VSVIDIKIVTKDGGSVPNLVKGIRTAVEQGASVINISLGTDKVEAADIQQITAAVDYAWNRGCLCVAASGNDGKGQGEIDQLAYPAGIDRVISVGAAAVDSNLQVSQIAPFSNENAKVAIAACGVGVLSCIPANKYAVYSGTSMATPHVTAACALIIQELKATSKLTGPALAAAATSALYEEVVDAGAPGKDPAFGYGFLRFDPTAGPYLPKGEAIQQGHTFLGYLIRS
jgi:subtilisin family serine protease